MYIEQRFIHSKFYRNLALEGGCFLELITGQLNNNALNSTPPISATHVLARNNKKNSICNFALIKQIWHNSDMCIEYDVMHILIFNILMLRQTNLSFL